MTHRFPGSPASTRRPWWAGLCALVLLLTLSAFGAQAQLRPAPPTPAAAAGQALRDVLTPAGRLQPGATGSFTAAGYHMSTDPRTGAPVFRATGAAPRPGALMLRTAGAGDERWQDGFPVPGADQVVFAIAVAANGDVYLGGDFRAIDNTPVGFVARWDGTAWNALGGGVNGTVRALALDGATLYAGGDFSQAGGGAASHVARWNGAAWSALGAGTNGSVYALAFAGTTLYAGGGTSRRPAGWRPATWRAGMAPRGARWARA